MVVLNEEQVRKLKVGDDVIYKERAGLLSGHLFKAKVIGKYPRFVLLSCAASKYFNEAYEDSERYFNTCFNYDDCVELGGYRLYKETVDDYLDEEVYNND